MLCKAHKRGEDTEQFDGLEKRVTGMFCSRFGGRVGDVPIDDAAVAYADQFDFAGEAVDTVIFEIVDIRTAKLSGIRPKRRESWESHVSRRFYCQRDGAGRLPSQPSRFRHIGQQLKSGQPQLHWRQDCRVNCQTCACRYRRHPSITTRHWRALQGSLLRFPGSID